MKSTLITRLATIGIAGLVLSLLASAALAASHAGGAPAPAGAAPVAAPTCVQQAADKKLAGAAKTSHIKKCMADEQAAAPKK